MKKNTYANTELMSKINMMTVHYIKIPAGFWGSMATYYKSFKLDIMWVDLYNPIKIKGIISHKRLLLIWFLICKSLVYVFVIEVWFLFRFKMCCSISEFVEAKERNPKGDFLVLVEKNPILK